MLPTTTCDRTTCLSSLIGVQSDPCLDPTKCPPFFVEQIDGVDIDKLSKIAGPADLSGKAYAERLIKQAAVEMTGDLELLIGNGYTLAETIGEVCSNCDFTNMYIPGGGIKIFNASLSQYSQIKITSFKLKANATGDHVLKIDDGVAPQTYPLTIQAGVEMPLNLLVPYITQRKSVYISLVDQTVGLAQITCPVKSGCGCGSSNSAKNLIQYSGTIGGMDASAQYGFIGCANIGCSSDILICEMVRQTPNLFGLTLLYKVGEKINTGSKLSLRNNRTSVQPDEIKDGEMFKYMGLYRKRLNGSATERGIRHIISDYLNKRSGDNCIQCVGNNRVAYVTG